MDYTHGEKRGGGLTSIKRIVFIVERDAKENTSEIKSVVAIGTPGRVEAAVLKQKRFSVKNLEFLILDEADRLLDLGFEMQVRGSFKGCVYICERNIRLVVSWNQ